MSNLEGQSRQLLGPLHAISDGEPESASVQAERERRVVAAMLMTATRPQYPRWAAPLAAAAATLALAAGLLLYVGARAPTHVRESVPGARVTALHGRVLRVGADGNNGPARGGQPLVHQDRLVVAAEATASVELGSGAVAHLSEGTEIALGTENATPLSERITLENGSVSLEVPPLRSGHSLAIYTPDATVRVVGTRFSVTAVPAPRGPRSCVAVHRGIVEVTAAGSVRRLLAGQHWSSDGAPCALSDLQGVPTGSAAPELPLGAAPPAHTEPTHAEPASAASTSTPTARRAAGRAGLTAQASSRTGAVPSLAVPSASPNLVDGVSPAASPRSDGEAAGAPTPTAAFGVSTLEQQIQLFTRAMDARRAGNHTQALRLLDQLITEHPDSPLAAQARGAQDAIRREASH